MLANIARLIQRFMIAVFSTGIIIGLLNTDGSAEEAASSNTIVDAIANGTPLADVRLRYEHVDQAGVANNANALTLRTRLGYETAAFHNIKLLAEVENITAIGDEDFNSTVNGNTSIPVVADPNGTELNRAQITYSGIPDTVLTGGRQRIILDNARFIGNVGWRQNEQTFDAVRLDNTSLENLTATYAYIGQAQRIFGNKSAVGEFTGDSHALNLTYSGFPFGALTGYAYLVDINETLGLSSASYGFRFKGSHPLDTINLLYTAEYAHQQDYEDNPATYSVNYYFLEAGAKYKALTGKVGYEVLGGDGTSAFQTPYATLHAFQGFADVFLTTPNTGIKDLQGSIAYVEKKVGPFDKVMLKAVYHDFKSEEGDLDYGSELDIVAAVSFLDHITLLAKYADYDADGFATDRRKFWLQAQAKL